MKWARLGSNLCSPSQAASPNGRKWTDGESGASLVAQTVKHLPGMQETRVWSLGWEDPPEKEMATHSSILGRRTPRTEEPDGLQSTGWQRVGHNWATKTFTYHQRIETWREARSKALSISEWGTMETTAWEKQYGPQAALKVLLLSPKNIRKKHIPTATDTLEKKGSVAGSLYLYTSGCQGDDSVPPRGHHTEPADVVGCHTWRMLWARGG